MRSEILHFESNIVKYKNEDGPTELIYYILKVNEIYYRWSLLPNKTHISVNHKAFVIPVRILNRKYKNKIPLAQEFENILLDTSLPYVNIYGHFKAFSNKFSTLSWLFRYNYRTMQAALKTIN